MHYVYILQSFRDGTNYIGSAYAAGSSVDLASAVKCPGWQVPMPDEVAVFQMPAGGFSGRAVNQSEPLGPVQGADFYGRCIFRPDEPPLIGEINFENFFLPRLQYNDITVDRLK